MRIFQFFAKKLGRLDIFDGRFLKIFNNESKKSTSPAGVRGFNLKNHEDLKKFPTS